MKSHKFVKHPQELLKAKTEFDKFETWVTDKLTTALGSFVVFAFCFVIPLLAITAPTSVKLIVGIVLSNWFQAWALPVLQRSQMKTQAQNDAKANVDHMTLTYLATTQDEQLNILKKLNRN